MSECRSVGGTLKDYTGYPAVQTKVTWILFEVGWRVRKGFSKDSDACTKS